MTYDRELRTEAAHALTHNQEVWSDRGYAVVTAGGLSEGDTDFELDVGPYDVLVGSTTQTSVGPTTLSVNAPDSDPYWLVVYADSDGLQTEQGPEGEVFVGDQSVDPASADVREITSPAPPTLADIGPVTVLGKVLVTSSGVSNSLIDDRVFQSERVFDVVNARSASVEEATVGGQPAAKSVTDDTATHTGDLVEVGPGETEIVFDVSDPVDIISGNIYAGEVGEVRAITTDGQVTVGGRRQRGADRTSDAFLDVRSVPNISDVETLEFDNASTSVENEYGWVVITA